MFDGNLPSEAPESQDVLLTIILLEGLLRLALVVWVPKELEGMSPFLRITRRLALRLHILDRARLSGSLVCTHNSDHDRQLCEHLLRCNCQALCLLSHIDLQLFGIHTYVQRSHHLFLSEVATSRVNLAQSCKHNRHTVESAAIEMLEGEACAIQLVSQLHQCPGMASQSCCEDLWSLLGIGCFPASDPASRHVEPKMVATETKDNFRAHQHHHRHHHHHHQWLKLTGFRGHHSSKTLLCSQALVASTLDSSLSWPPCWILFVET